MIPADSTLAVELAEIRRRVAQDEADFLAEYPPPSLERLAWAESIVARCFGPRPYTPARLP